MIKPLIQIKCPHCRTYEMSESELQMIIHESFMTGFSICPRCNDEAYVFLDGKRIDTDDDLKKLKSLVLD